MFIKKYILSISMGFLILLFGLLGPVEAFPNSQQGDLPQITYLGQGPQTFTLEPPLEFLVKTYRNGQFLFETVEPPTYEAKAHERVWSTDFLPQESIRLFDEDKSFGQVPAGCVVNYVQIEDNIDNRRNTFYINEKELQTVDQGMVTYGSFTVPEAGELTFFAEDSIGLIVQLCQETALTATTSATPAVTETTVPPADTATAVPSGATPATAVVVIPSDTPAPEQPTATTELVQPSVTATNQTGEMVVTVMPVPTSGATPAVIPLTGGGPGPREIGWLSLGILAALGLVAGAWWRLLRWYQRGK